MQKMFFKSLIKGSYVSCAKDETTMHFLNPKDCVCITIAIFEAMCSINLSL